jgi:hypothetical protein
MFLDDQADMDMNPAEAYGVREYVKKVTLPNRGRLLETEKLTDFLHNSQIIP